MAEAATVAFGRYLRELRTRRGLSLLQVCELCEGSIEGIDKGTLSRFERGQQTPSVFRLAPLCRIYEVSADVLFERMELDRELDRLGEPDTQGRSYDDLFAAGGDALVHGHRKWDAYACFRDALAVAPDDQRLKTRLNLVTAIRSLGKNTLALHELRELASAPGLDAAHRAVVYERISQCHRCLGDMKKAEECADEAAAQALTIGDFRALAYAYVARSAAAIDQEQWAVASAVLMKAISACGKPPARESGLRASPAFEAQTLLMLAECALKLRQMTRARRIVNAAQRLSREHDVSVGLAYAELILGWIDEADGQPDRALARWRRASALARKIDNVRLVFTAEVEIFRRVSDAGDAARVRASRRRLRRLAPWIPKHVPAFREFQRLIDRGGHSDEDAPMGPVDVARRRNRTAARRGRYDRGVIESESH